MKHLLLLAAFLPLASCGPRGVSKATVDAAAAQHDPAKLKLWTSTYANVEEASLPSGVQLGIVPLGDGERVKFWFYSHHRGRDLGCTRFQYSDGSVDYLDGYFCCEVMLPGERLANRQALREFIAANDGEKP